MKMLKIIVIALLVSGTAHARSTVSDLYDELESGGVVLDSVRGNGSSSGPSVLGFLINKTGTAKKINIDLVRPLYLKNNGRRQNMVATRIYRRGGGYLSDGKNSFIKLDSNEKLPIVFNAYCADFDRENPTAADSFAIGEMPATFKKVTRNIREYVSRNPDVDVTAAAQLAFWFVQGESAEDIRKKFNFSWNDEMLGRQFIQ